MTQNITNISTEVIMSSIDYCFKEQFTNESGDYFSTLKDLPLPNDLMGVDGLVTYCIERIMDELEIDGIKKREKYYDFLQQDDLFIRLFEDTYYHYVEIYKLKF